MLLAIDTSTEMASLALAASDRLLAESTWHCGQNHTVQLLPQLTAMLEKVRANIQEVEGVVVARGPGSFNGLRVGMSTAKGLAFSLGVPIVGISTLEAAAYQHAASGLPVCVLQNAGRSEIAAAVYRMIRRKWQQKTAEHITTLETLISGIPEKTLFCGELNTEMITAIKQQLKTKAVIPCAAALPRRSYYLAELGRQRLAAGCPDNPATLQPLYLRRPPITERKHH